MTLLERDMEVIYRLPASEPVYIHHYSDKDIQDMWAIKNAQPIEDGPRCLGCGESGMRINNLWYCFTDGCSFVIEHWKG